MIVTTERKKKRKVRGLRPRDRYIIERLSERQNHRCCYCGVRFSEIVGDDHARSREHIIPWTDGGRWTQKNLVIACRKCNNNRGDMDLIEYLTKINIPCHDFIPSDYMIHLQISF